MRKIALILIATLLPLMAWGGEKELSQSDKFGEYIYIYKLDHKQVRELFVDKKLIDDRYMTNYVDRYRWDAKRPTLERGNYLLVQAVGNKLEFSSYTEDDLVYKLFTRTNFEILVADKYGVPITNAEVKLGSRRVKYDPKRETYFAKKLPKEVRVEINNNGVLHYIDRQWYRPYYDRYNTYDSGYNVVPRRFQEPEKKSKYTGYMLFSKPIYRPGDTVRMKAYLTTLKGKPVKKDVELQLSDYNSWRNEGVDTVLTTLSPYRAGAYKYEFVLNDGLGLMLDNNYSLEMVDPKDKDKTPLFLGVLSYEDYELTRSQFTARTDKGIYGKSESVSLFVKATNESGMAEFDGEVEIEITSSGASSYYVDEIFIPSKLWNHRVKIERAGEMEIEIPDSIWIEGVDMGYSIECVYRSSDEEMKESYLYINKRMSEYTMTFDRGVDGLTIKELKSEEPIASWAKVTAFSISGQEIESQRVELPATIEVLQNASYYVVKTDKQITNHHLGRQEGVGISYTFERVGTGAELKIQNPTGLAFWYRVSTKDGKKILASGYVKGKELNRVIKSKGRLEARIEFLQGGWINSSEQMLQDVKNEMTINVTTPQTIYPGQSTEFKVEVVDGQGRAVRDADVTAFAYTSKFNRSTYITPYPRRDFNFKQGETAPSFQDVKIEKELAKMEWDRWRDKMELGEIEFYKFLRPEPIYSYSEPARDGVTQISPYVVIDGDVQGAHIVWVDNAPHFFRNAEQLQPYTFAVSEGKHNVKIRTFDRVVTLKNIEVKSGHKTIIAIDGAQSAGQSGIEVTKIDSKERPKGVLTASEMEYISNFLISFDPNINELEFRVNRYNSLWLPSYVSTGNRLYWANHKDSPYMYNYGATNTSTVVGPFPYRTDADLVVGREHIKRFDIEGGYHYTLTPDMVKMKSWSADYLLNLRKIDSYLPDMKFDSQPVTREDIESDIKNRVHLRLRERLANITRPHPDKMVDEASNRTRYRGNGSLYLEIDTTDAGKSVADPLYIRLYSEIDSVYYYYRGNLRTLYNLPTQRLEMRLVMDDYSVYERVIDVKADGTNFLRLRSIPTSNGYVKEVKSEIYGYLFSEKKQERDSGGLSYINPENLGDVSEQNLKRDVITGVVKSSAGSTTSGITIKVEGANLYTVTDLAGRFELDVKELFNKGDSATYKLLFLPPLSNSGERGIITELIRGYDYNQVFIGSDYDDMGYLYSTRWLDGGEVGDEYGLLGLQAETGSSKRKSTAEVSVSKPVASLGGVSQNLEESLDITAASKDAVHVINQMVEPPFIILNGLPYNGTLESIDEQSIVSLKLIEPEQAVKLYGSQGANGVLVIVTLNTDDGFDGEGMQLRRNFRDDAFWEPTLTTDRGGVAKFETTYPDDITSWNAQLYAMKGSKYIAKKTVSISSFKALNAQLSLPRFAIEGDRLDAMGRVTNYMGEARELTLKITENGKTTESQISVETSHTDRISTTAQRLSKEGGDSLSVKYTIEGADGYFDGEERAIAIYPMGVEVSEGVFEVINSGERKYEFDTALGEVNIHAEGSSKELFMREIERVDEYPYMCNEQMASKLKAMLSKKQIYAIFDMKFKDARKIEKLISDLKKNQNSSGMWGWWGREGTTSWISKHVLEAMLMAEQEGFYTELDYDEVRDRLLIGLNAINLSGKYRMANKREYNNNILLLHRLGAELDYAKLLERTNSVKDTIMYDRVLSMRARQLAGLEISIKELMSMADSTMLGGLKWSEKAKYVPVIRYIPQLDDMQTTLLAYTILRDTKGEESRAERVRNYMFEVRRSGWWSNIYESSTIMTTIIPDMLKGGETFKGVEAEINGVKVTDFPYKTTIQPSNGVVSVTKSGTPPLFFTAYQNRWDSEPKRSNKGFEVSSVFMSGKDTVSMLTAGEKVEMVVSVKIDADADYVVIEAPIPAGCTYDSKSQNWYGREIHREYHRDRVAIFVSHLTKGEHQFRIELLPRFTGVYSLNPAKAELMYFPTHYGHEQMKQMTIEQRQE